MCDVERELKERMKSCGMNVKKLATELQKPYSSVAGRLNGFMPLQQEDRSKIVKILTEAEKIIRR